MNAERESSPTTERRGKEKEKRIGRNEKEPGFCSRFNFL